MAYRIYITDSLKILIEDVLNMSGAGGSKITVRYYEVIEPKETKIETRTAKDVIDHVKAALGRLS